MLPFWLVDLNYYTAFAAAFIGNALIILLSLKVRAQEIRDYRWIISSQAALELLACTMKVLMKFVSFYAQL